RADREVDEVRVEGAVVAVAERLEVLLARAAPCARRARNAVNVELRLPNRARVRTGLERVGMEEVAGLLGLVRGAHADDGPEDVSFVRLVRRAVEACGRERGDEPRVLEEALDLLGIGDQALTRGVGELVQIAGLGLDLDRVGLRSGG